MCCFVCTFAWKIGSDGVISWSGINKSLKVLHFTEAKIIFFPLYVCACLLKTLKASPHCFIQSANAELRHLKMIPNPIYVILPILRWCRCIQIPSLAIVHSSEISHGLVTCCSLRVEERHSGAAADCDGEVPSRVKNKTVINVRRSPSSWMAVPSVIRSRFNSLSARNGL